jgi:hypothetical protein
VRTQPTLTIRRPTSRLFFNTTSHPRHHPGLLIAIPNSHSTDSWLLELLEKEQSFAAPLVCAVAFGDRVMGCTLFLPPRACILVLCFGVSFHLGIAMVLGLNTFFWSFVAAYPAILWVSHSMYRDISL